MARPFPNVREGWRYRLVALAVPLLLASPSRADEAKARAEEDPYLRYRGVTLEGGEPPAIKTPPPGFQYINWPGFRSHEKRGTEVFLQLTGPVSYKLWHRGRRVELRMDKVQVFLRNNLLPVITKHFPGPVDEYRLRQLKGDRMGLEIRLHRRAKPSVEQKAIGPYTYLIVRFPPR